MKSEHWSINFSVFEKSLLWAEDVNERRVSKNRHWRWSWWISGNSNDVGNNYTSQVKKERAKEPTVIVKLWEEVWNKDLKDGKVDGHN